MSQFKAFTKALCALAALVPALGAAQNLMIIRVPSHVWQGLDQNEKDSVGSKYVVDLLPSELVGVIVDAQGVDRSDPGTTGGRWLGAAVGSAAYVDRAFKGSGDYSAKSHLGVALLGALVGSALDRPASQKYHYRYTVKTLSNKIEYLDEHSVEPFRKSLGACVSVPSLDSVPQDMCSETDDTFRKKYVQSGPRRKPIDTVQGGVNKMGVSSDASPVLEDALIKCKFGLNSPVLVERAVCESARGEILK